MVFNISVCTGSIIESPLTTRAVFWNDHDVDMLGTVPVGTDPLAAVLLFVRELGLAVLTVVDAHQEPRDRVDHFEVGVLAVEEDLFHVRKF